MLPILLSALALAAPVGPPVSPDPVHVLDPMGWAAGADTYDLLLEAVAGSDAWRRGETFLVPGADGVLRPLQAYRPVNTAPVDKEQPLTRSLPIVHPGRADGALSGRVVYVSQCHGYRYFDTLGRFSTQRPNLFETIEDFHNPEGANAWLIPYLENAGAAVFTARERDPSPVMAIADNDGTGYFEQGTTFTAGEAGFRQLARIPYDTDPFDAGTTRRFDGDSGDTVTWLPSVPEDGVYAVYVTWDANPAHASDAHYVLHHPGGTIHRRFDQRVHGSTWQYVETLWLPQGVGGLRVQLLGDSQDAGAWLSADAVRVGGGPAEVERVGAPPPTARWEASAISYTQYNGAPSSIYDADVSMTTPNGDGTDHVARSKWAKWEHPSGEDAIYLSWHSNASEFATARGTVVYFAGGGTDAPLSEPAECSRPAVTGSYSYARLLQDELVDAVRSLHDGGWNDRGVGTACFSEVSPSFNDEMPSALVELAFHDNAADVAFLKDPAFRRDAARAMYRATVRYFAERDGVPPVYLPEPPLDLALVHDSSGQLRLSWAPGATGAPYGDAPDSYLVQTSADGLVWRHRFAVSGTSTTVPLLDGVTRYVRVIAVNPGGMSFPSEVIGARKSPDGTAPVLVVSGFDRLDRGLLNRRQAAYVGQVVTMDLPAMNPFDTAVAHGEAVREAGWFFDTVSDEALLTADLSSYEVIWWVAGEESSLTSTITPAHQVVLSQFLNGGGSVIVTGAEVLWDLDELGSTADRDFAANVLGATMAADDAGTTEADGAGPLSGLTLDFGVADGAPYPVEYPDVLASSRTVIARYAGGATAGVYGGGVALLGFPFECIGDADTRADVARVMLPLLAPGVTPPTVASVPDTGVLSWPSPGGDTGEDTDGVATDSGPEPVDSTPVVDTPDDPEGRAVDNERVPLEELGGCGCVSGTSPAGGGLAMMAATLLVGIRRRRRSH